MPQRISILGAGPGGYAAALRAAQLGADVTLIEKENVGGTCLNWGCIPSKIMKTAAALLENCRRAGDFGIRSPGPAAPDMAALMKRKRAVVDSQIKGIEALLARCAVTLVRGRGHIRAPGRLAVEHESGEITELDYEQLIVAAGSRPQALRHVPFDGRRVISSNEALGLDTVPESMLIVGGGVIGCEFASILSALGARVTIVEALDRLLPLPTVDHDCSKVFLREMKKRKIQVLLNRIVDTVTEENGRLCVGTLPSPTAETHRESDGKPLVIEAQKVLVCIGRRPLTADLGLDTVGVELDAGGWIVADDRMQTSVSGIYAVGDILGPQKAMLAHVASAEGRVAAENAMGARKRMRYDAVPGAVFTLPEIACVGLTEAQARENGLSVRSDTVMFRNIGKAQVQGDIAGHAKIVSATPAGTILGVHLIGPNATDLIAEGALAVQNRLTVAQMADTIHAHPTLAEIMLEVSLKAAGMAVHG